MTNVTESSPKAIYLKDYKEPDYWISKTDLVFDLYDDFSEVTSTLTITKNSNVAEKTPLVLAGQELELVAVAIDGEMLDEDAYTIDSDSLTIHDVPDEFELCCVTHIKPQENTSLEGLYRSRTMYCTQCEAEGFRKITYYLDRPDVMSEFTTRISADKTQYPVLLSNGNLMDSGDEGVDNRHWALWQDPFKKPCYLFALVAGDLANIDDTFTTASGREVLLRLFVEPKDINKCDHAITSLKNSMKWDEQVYGREYDLDIFMIVAVDDFNMGAMENKGLNIFNTSCVLANPKTTTDAGFQRVEGVVAHEYFHNWSGNRVTCRDWFQLSLKEGFTVFRDAEFSSDMGSRTVKRVEDVSLLRAAQFAEDAGPMAHPVRPSSFIEISNFYTLTIYEKGAEVVRMIRTLLGEELFRKGSDLYFERHDGQAVTIDDFIAAMKDVSGRDFSQFMNWYEQAATPVVKVKDAYDAEAKTYTLTVEQSCRPTAECQNKKPFHIPMAVSLHGDAGALKLSLVGDADDCESADNTYKVLEITEPKQAFVFNHIPEKPVPALFKAFSAPVKYEYSYTMDELAKLMCVDDDGFTRWDACQQMALAVINNVIRDLGTTPSPDVNPVFVSAMASLLTDISLDPAMVALMLSLPKESVIGDQQTIVEVDVVHHARKRVERKLAHDLEPLLLQTYTRLHSPTEAYSATSAAIANRSLKNTALSYLVATGKEEYLTLANTQFEIANNMTDQLAALTVVVNSQKAMTSGLCAKLLASFYAQWKDESLVMNHWFTVQATCALPGALERVNALMIHEAYDGKNPNKIRSVVGAFCTGNIVSFHQKSGAGYSFLKDQVLKLNKTNPQIASRLLTPLTRWQRYDESRQALMKAALMEIQSETNLSKDVFEIVSKSLA